MKKIILILLTITFILNGCSKSNNDENTNPSTNNCASVASFDVTQQSDYLVFNITSTSTPLYYEVSYQNASSNPNPDYGQTFIMDSLSLTKSITNLSLGESGTYIFYVRAICSTLSRSNWSLAKVVTISSYCSKPSNLQYVSGGYLTWQNNTGNSASTSNSSQVQYGVHGFLIGTGLTLNELQNSSSTSGFILNGNTTYDFYVRSFCPSSQLWSPWSDVFTFENLTNPCLLPTNLSHQIESTNSQTAYVSLRWNDNGGNNFEYTVVAPGSQPSSGTIYTAPTNGWPVMILSRTATYNFYMRTVCSNGSRTGWTLPHLISNL
jgi:hypothetical protein